MRIVLSFLISCICFAQLMAQQTAETLRAQIEEIAIIEQKVMVPMRDGIRLATDIYRPKTKGPVPVVFVKTPYNFNTFGDGKEQARPYQWALEAVKRGYAYVVQNERGRYFSEGVWDILGPPVTDGYDAFSWIKDQPWSNGRIGTFGCSSTAEWQMAVAALDHPAHAAMVPMGFGAGVGRIGHWYEQGNWYRGGAQQMLFTVWLYSIQHVQRPTFPAGMSQEDLVRASRFYDLAAEMPEVDWSEALHHLPVSDILENVQGPKGIYQDMIRRKPNDPKWYEGGLYHDDMPFGVPAMWFVSWYDVSTGPNLALYNHIREHAEDPEVSENQYLVIAPTLHCAYWRSTENTIVGERNMGDARLDYNALIYGWFDHWLKGENNNFPEDTPKVQYYLMGANTWKSANTWPPENTEMTTWYLSSAGNANSLFGDGTLSRTAPVNAIPPDRFTYDPMNPVPSLGGGVCCTGNAVEGGAFDQRGIESRHDVLVYTSDPLEEGIEVTGSIDITLFVGSDVRDTDFTVKLLDVYPDGRAYNLDETIQRMRYRDGYDREVFMEADAVYEVSPGPLATSNYFEKGHRIRIEVSSSNFPRFERNLNTGGNNYDERKGVVAKNIVYHSATYPSRIVLPIVKRRR